MSGRCRRSLELATSPCADPTAQRVSWAYKELQHHLKPPRQLGYLQESCNGSKDQDGRHAVNQKCQRYILSFFSLSFYSTANGARREHLIAYQYEIN